MSFRIITLTQGNLTHDHLYLTDAWDLIPADSVGGGNENEAAPTALEVHFGLGNPVSTDVAGDKKIFRKRAWVREFYQAHSLTAGSRVVIEKTGPHRFHVYPVR
ncbi:MAG: hypothetical protein AB7F79_02255 [Steroidobacteraceae bacterium]